MTIFIMTAVMLLTLFSPFGVYYGIRLARNKDYISHRRIQNIIFTIGVVGVLALEILIRYSGGSGSLASNSKYYDSKFFTITWVSHIVVAILTYFLWTVLIVLSNSKFRKSLSGKLSEIHKKLGEVIFGGLIYTAVSALAVYLMNLNLVW